MNNTDPSGMITLSELGASAAFTTSLGATFGAALGGVLGSATGIGGWRGAYLGTLAGTAIGFGIASHQGTEVLTSAFFDGTISLLTQLAVEGINLNSDTQPPFPGDLHTRLAEAFLTGFSNGAVSAAFTVGLPDSVVTGPLFAAAHSAVNDLVDALRFGAWPDWTELTFDALSQFLFAAVSSPELLFALQRTPGVSKDKVASVLEKLHELGAEKAKAISLAVVGVIWGTVLREVDLVFGNEKTPF